MVSQAQGMNAEQANDLLTRIMDLSQAATTAAQTATSMMQAAQGGKGGQRFGDGARVLKSPDVFDTDDPVRYSFWREQFLNWLVFCDGRYNDLIKDVKNLDNLNPFHTLEQETQELSTKLYSILVSYLRGPAIQVVRAFSNNRDGFGVWHKLKSLYAPRARPRALAIGQAIMQHPAFSTQRSMLENLLNFDSLLDQYELASGQPMPDDLAVSTILRCIDAPTRRHLEMVMEDDVTYSKLKERLILLDKNTKAWSGDGFLRNLQQLQNPTSSSSTSYQGPAPMEVDQVQFGQKGKGKSKGKSKGKKGGWFGMAYGGKYGGKSNGKSKGKNKGKKGKGKNKGKSQKGKGYGSGSSNNTCRICGQQGHWGNERPSRNQVSQVNSTAPSDGPTIQPADSVSNAPRRMSTASTTSTTTASSKAVRLVKMYHVATPPQGPEHYELRSDLEEEDEWYGVRMVCANYFNMAAGENEDDSSVGEERAALMEWYDNLQSPMDQVHCGDELEVYHVRAVPLCDGQLVVLDSGADISLLPQEMADRGQSTKRLAKTVLEDAQGGCLRTYGRRSAQIEMEGENDELIVLRMTLWFQA